MSVRPRDAEQTRSKILAAARRLFAERGINTVSIRDIAAAAGVSHGLVQQYCGTRKNMVAGIIKCEIDAVMSSRHPIPDDTTNFDLEQLRLTLLTGAERFREFARIIMRAELAGIEPEKLLDPAVPTPAMILALGITEMQAECTPENRPAMEPKLVSAYINAALFGFATLAPWLMMSVGLNPEDYEKSIDEVVDITMKLVALAGGMKQ